jgi:hypothetical protein
MNKYKGIPEFLPLIFVVFDGKLLKETVQRCAAFNVA